MPSGARRKRVWARNDVDLTATNTGTVLRPLTNYRFDAGITAGPVGATIAAVRLSFGTEVTVAGTGTSLTLIVAGLVTEEQTTAEVTRPLARQHGDWFIWDVESHDTAIGARGDRSGADALFNKSMRKVEELQDDFVLVFQVFEATGSINVKGYCSTLLLLP